MYIVSLSVVFIINLLIIGLTFTKSKSVYFISYILLMPAIYSLINYCLYVNSNTDKDMYLSGVFEVYLLYAGIIISSISLSIYLLIYLLIYISLRKFKRIKSNDVQDDERPAKETYGNYQFAFYTLICMYALYCLYNLDYYKFEGISAFRYSIFRTLKYAFIVMLCCYPVVALLFAKSYYKKLKKQ